MKSLILALLFVSSASFADTYVSGYTRSNGTYVAPHYQTAPDSNPYNNYSNQGNVNPYNGNVGYHNPQPTYGTGHYNSYGR